MKNLKDLIVFGKIISVGLVIAGYTFLGAWLAGWLKANDYSNWLALAALAAGVLMGLWQGWLVLTKRNNKTKAKDKGGADNA